MNRHSRLRLSLVNLYFFGWPGSLGGASTKLAHLLPLLRHDFAITVVPNTPADLRSGPWPARLADWGIRCRPWPDLPRRLRGWGVALCNAEFVAGGLGLEARRRGLRLAWSNEMMWHFPGELGLLMAGCIDTLLYTSPVQRAALEPAYRQALTGRADAPAPDHPEATEGRLPGGGHGQGVRWAVTGNYIDPAAFPWRPPRDGRSGLVVGRLSRPDPAKFPADFPWFYEGLGLRNPRFRVMAWSGELAQRWSAHGFDARWDLLPAEAEDAGEFLRTLDLFIYSVGRGFSESWGRAVVEAMLSGAVPLVPADPRHHLRHLVVHGETGAACATNDDFATWARRLEQDPARRRRLARQARAHAGEHLCNTEMHRETWARVFHGR